MIATNPDDRQRNQKAWEELSREQDDQAAQGIQQTYSQAHIARTVGLSRARIEQLEIGAKLRLLKGLAATCPQCLLDLGGTYEQLAFLQAMNVTAAVSRKLWRQWSQLSESDERLEKETSSCDPAN